MPETPKSEAPIIEYEFDHYMLTPIVCMRVDGRKVDEISLDPIKVFNLSPERVAAIEAGAVRVVAKKYGKGDATP